MTPPSPAKVTVRQRHAWIVDMRKGDIVELPEYSYWENARARAVTRVATQILGEPYAYTSNVNRYNGSYAALVPRASPSVEGAQNTNWDPDGIDVYMLRFQHPHDASVSDLNGQPFITGGVPAVYDGEHLHEMGYHYQPWLGKMTQGAVGSLEALGSYAWTAIYEWRDARGYVHRSVPAMIKSLALDPGMAQVYIDVPNLTLTEKEDVESDQWTVRVVLYRTEDSGDTFYFDQSAPNDPENPYVTFNSVVADTTLRTREILYTDGGVKPNFQPPAISHSVHHESRLWAISKDDPHMIWVSKIIQPGWEMPGFALEFIIKSDVGGGHIALASLGTQLIAIKEEGVYAYAGDAPNDLGEGGTLRGPVPVALHTGCINPRSVVAAPNGVAFQTRESIWMIDRGLGASRIGASVEDKLAAWGECRSAVLDQTRECLYFLMQPSGIATSCVILCYHYLIDAWTVWEMPGSVASIAVCWSASLQRHELVLVSDGRVATLSDGYVDDDYYPRTTVSTPWINFAGLVGFVKARRVQLRGEHIGSHTLRVRAYYDYDDTIYDEWTWTPAEIAALLSGSEMHIDVHLKRQKCKTIKVEVRASAASPATGGLVRWEAAVFKIGGKKGLFALPLLGKK